METASNRIGSNTKTAAGDSVSIPIFLGNIGKHQISALDLAIDFDQELVELSGVENGLLAKEWPAPLLNTSGGRSLISFASPNPFTEPAGDLLYLVFKIKSEATGSFDITLDQNASSIMEGQIPFKAFNGTVIINEAPSDILISNKSVIENTSILFPVATLSATDLNLNDTHTYELISGDGDSNNDLFVVNDNKLFLKKASNYEELKTYEIRIRVADFGGLTFEKAITIDVDDVNEYPHDIVLSSTSFDENVELGSIVSALSAVDPDIGDNHLFEFVSGEGDADNKYFLIQDNRIIINTVPDFESKSSYDIRLKAEDSKGLTVEKQFSLEVNDVVERIISLPANQSFQRGQDIAIPILIDDTSGLSSFDIVLSFPSELFGESEDLPIVVPGSSLPLGWNLTANLKAQEGKIILSGYSANPMLGGSGTIAELQLTVNHVADLGQAPLSFNSVNLNEGNYATEFKNGVITIRPSSFQVLDVRELPNGLALKLSKRQISMYLIFMMDQTLVKILPIYG